MCVGNVRPGRDLVHFRGVLQGDGVAHDPTHESSRTAHQPTILGLTDVCELAILENQEIMFSAELL